MRDRHRSIYLLMVLVAAATLLISCSPATATPSPIGTAGQAPSPGGGSGAASDETGDPADEPGASETSAVGFTLAPTGEPAPTASAAAMTRLNGEPDPVLTPGSLNPAVTQANIGSTICQSGWTATIRPPTSYTNNLKALQIAQYRYADESLASYEEDHLISLELGGNPTDSRNLWPEPYNAMLGSRKVGAHVKDSFETRLKNEVCAGTITLAEAQAEVGDHWVHYDFQIP